MIPKEYLKDERIKDVLVGYSVPPKAEGRLKRLQEALYQTREESVRRVGWPVLEGILLFGSFVRGKEEPGDIDIFPFFDFSKYVPEEDNFRNYIKKSNQTHYIIKRFGELYKNNGGTPHLETTYFNAEYCYVPKCYIDCTNDGLFSNDWQEIVRLFQAIWSLRTDGRTFKPRLEHILGPKRLKEQFKRIQT